MAIKIISKRDGFRRCGVEHPDRPVIHPAGKFTEEQVKQLKAEPMLIVEVVPDEAKETGKGKADKQAEKQAGDTAKTTTE